MFPEHSGIYVAQRADDIVIVKVKGVYPSLQLDKNAIHLSKYFKSGKIVEVPKELFENMEIFHSEWNFTSLDFLNFGVFSKTEFAPDGAKLYLSEEDMLSIGGKYYRLCQQGVSPIKVIRALSYEFKVSTEQIIHLINGFDRQQ